MADSRNDFISFSDPPSSKNLLIRGDFNCHNPLWDSRGTFDPREKGIFDWFIFTDLLPTNDLLLRSLHFCPFLLLGSATRPPDFLTVPLSALSRLIERFPFYIYKKIVGTTLLFILMCIVLLQRGAHLFFLQLHSLLFWHWVQKIWVQSSTSLALTWIFSFPSLIYPDLCIPFFPFGSLYLLFSSTRWQNHSFHLISSTLSLSPSVSQTCLSASFYPIYSSFLSPTSFSLLARPISVLAGLLLIKFFIVLSPF